MVVDGSNNAYYGPGENEKSPSQQVRKAYKKDMIRLTHPERRIIMLIRIMVCAFCIGPKLKKPPGVSGGSFYYFEIFFMAASLLYVIIITIAIIEETTTERFIVLDCFKAYGRILLFMPDSYQALTTFLRPALGAKVKIYF